MQERLRSEIKQQQAEIKQEEILLHKMWNLLPYDIVEKNVNRFKKLICQFVVEQPIKNSEIQNLCSIKMQV